MNIHHSHSNGFDTIVWPENSGMTISRVVGAYPEIIVGKFVVNTSFDSGFLTLSASELAAGWRMIGKFAHSPRITSIDELPHDQFDEWLVFESPTQIVEFETMVNYYGFTPIDFGWDEKRERFWDQVVRLNPLHVIGENTRTYLVTRDRNLLGALMAA